MTGRGERPTRVCPSCYALNAWERTTCARCGATLDAPRDFEAGLLWALDHPDTATAILAAMLLARRQEVRAIEPLGRLLARQGDPYRAAAAARALRAFIGDPVADGYLAAARAHPSVIVRRAAAGPGGLPRVAAERR
ncbi:MAG: HEAT repeat domain-containing protein [Candidatus Limnocylindrales bacterium]